MREPVVVFCNIYQFEDDPKAFYIGEVSQTEDAAIERAHDGCVAIAAPLAFVPREPL